MEKAKEAQILDCTQEDCSICPAQEICPFVGEEEVLKQKVVRMIDEMWEVLFQELVSPALILEALNTKTSVFNWLVNLRIKDKHSKEEEIYAYICKNLIKLDLNFQELVGKARKIVEKVIKEIVQKILLMIEDKCDKRCRFCFLAEYCPKKIEEKL